MFALAKSVFLASAADAVAQMQIDKIQIINNCESDVYFAQSVPSNEKISAGANWSGDWKVGHGNIAGRLSFSYFEDAFAKGAAGSNNPLDNVWVEIARSDISPGELGAAGGFNFANQMGFLDLDLEIAALTDDHLGTGPDHLVCIDAKARTALDPSKCSGFSDGSGSVKTLTRGDASHKDGVRARTTMLSLAGSRTPGDLRAPIRMQRTCPTIRCCGFRLEIPPPKGAGLLNRDPRAIGRRMIKKIAPRSTLTVLSAQRAAMVELPARMTQANTRTESTPSISSVGSPAVNPMR
jgi:hypothetical protein